MHLTPVETRQRVRRLRGRFHEKRGFDSLIHGAFHGTEAFARAQLTISKAIGAGFNWSKVHSHKIVFQTKDIQMAAIVFVEFVANKTATNSTNWHELKFSTGSEEFTAA